MAAFYTLTLYFTDDPELLRRKLAGFYNRNIHGPIEYDTEVIKFGLPAGPEGKEIAVGRARRLTRENEAVFGSLRGPRGRLIDYGQGSI